MLYYSIIRNLINEGLIYLNYIKITTTKYYRNQTDIIISIEDKHHSSNKKLTLNLLYPLEILNEYSDQIKISVLNNGFIKEAYVERKIYLESKNKEEIIKEYLEIPNIFLFKGVNYIKTNYKNLKIEMENNNEYKRRKVL